MCQEFWFADVVASGLGEGTVVGLKIWTSAISVTVRTFVVELSVPVTKTCLSLYLLRSIVFGISRTTNVPFRSESKYLVSLPTAILSVPARLITRLGLGEAVADGKDCTDEFWAWAFWKLMP